LAQTLSGPSVVALAPVEPMSLAQTYLGSQCQAQIQIGTQSALSILPGINNIPGYISTLQRLFNTTVQHIQTIFKQ
jgi:hypothetical protein